MNTIRDHIEYVELNPFDKPAALALADRLCEERGDRLLSALRYVARMRWPGRQAHYIARAAAIARNRSRSAMLATDVVCALAGQATSHGCVLVIVTGFRSPKIGARAAELPDYFPAGLLVSVGAREFLRLRRVYLHHLRSTSQTVRRFLTPKKEGAK